MKNGPPPKPPEPLSDELVRVLAEIQTSVDRVASGQKEIKNEVRILSVRIDDLAQKLHRTNNIATTLTNDASVLRTSVETMDRAIEFFEAREKVRVFENERTQKTLERAIDVLERRVRVVRDELADHVAEEGKTE